jgi:hypothetical protein
MIVRQVDDKNLMQRYMIVEYPGERKIGLDEKRSFKGHLPIHHLLLSYHWTHLDARHVLVIGTYASRNHNMLDQRQDVSLLPSIHSTKPVKHIVKKQEHFKALQKKHEINDTSTMGDLIDEFAVKHGSVFAPRQ